MEATRQGIEYRGRWEDGEPGWRRYRTRGRQGERYEVLTFICVLCADSLMHTEHEHKLVVDRHPGRYVREAHRGFRPKRRPRTPPDRKGTRR